MTISIGSWKNSEFTEEQKKGSIGYQGATGTGAFESSTVYLQGVIGGWAEWAIIHLGGTALLFAHPALDSYLHPCIYTNDCPCCMLVE